MLSVDEDALLCDFVETYHITDMRELPIPLWATLASGLRENSRIRMKMSGTKITLDEMLSAMIVDRLGRLFWIQSGSARTKKPAPESVLDMISGRTKKETNTELRTYSTPEDFRRAWNEITGN